MPVIISQLVQLIQSGAASPTFVCILPDDCRSQVQHTCDHHNRQVCNIDIYNIYIYVALSYMYMYRIHTTIAAPQVQHTCDHHRHHRQVCNINKNMYMYRIHTMIAARQVRHTCDHLRQVSNIQWLQVQNIHVDYRMQSATYKYHRQVSNKHWQCQELHTWLSRPSSVQQSL